MKNNTRTSPFRYGVGMFGTSLSINMFRSLAAAFYVIKMGLSTEALATITFVYTFIDALDNPVYGYLSDNTRTRIGRRKPWLLVGAPLYVVFFIFFFAPPAMPKEGLFWWALIFYSIAGSLDSLLNANYGALFPELFPTEKERAKTNGIRQLCQLIAMVIGVALTPMIVSKIGYPITAIIYGLVSLAVILYMTLGVKEPDVSIHKEKVKIFPALKSMFKSKNFWFVGAANACYSAAMALVMMAVPFYIEYSLKIASSQSTFILGTVILVAVAFIFVWNVIIRKLNAQRAWRVALIILAISFIPLFFANSLGFAIGAAAIVGVGFSGVISTMDLMGAKVLDEDYQKHGVKREGIFSSAMGFMNRLSGLFLSLALLLASKIYGFESGDEPGTRPGEAAKFMLIIFPFIMTLLGIMFTYFVKFSNKKIPTDKIDITRPATGAESETGGENQ